MRREPTSSNHSLQKRLVIGLLILTLVLLVNLANNTRNGLLLSFIPFEGKPWDIQGNVSYTTQSDTSQKIILLWNKFFKDDNPYLKFNTSSCRVNNCVLTNDRSFLTESDAIIFHVRGLNLVSNDIPLHRKPSQRYVFLAVESPNHTWVELQNDPWPGFFNLTWTYRMDSDILTEFYLKDFRYDSWNGSETNLTVKLDRGIALITNCDSSSKRENYLKEVGKHFPVDIFGRCGKPDPCAPKYEEKCIRDLVAKYKFYFAFENSICKDYMTEKVLRPLSDGSVPVVLGGGPYKQLLPPGSFIDAGDFRSPKDLGDYLSIVSRNPKIYREFFDWRTSWNDTKLLYDPQEVSICKLCEILNEPGLAVRVYDDIDGWWNREGRCTVWSGAYG